MPVLPISAVAPFSFSAPAAPGAFQFSTQLDPSTSFNFGTAGGAPITFSAAPAGVDGSAHRARPTPLAARRRRLR